MLCSIPPPPPPPSTIKSVRFSTITIHEVPIVLGDNPSRSRGGPPIQLGWGGKHAAEDGDGYRIHTQRLDMYDYLRAGQRRRGAALIVPSLDRTNALRRSGRTAVDIARATIDADATLKLRHETNREYMAERRLQKQSKMGSTKSSPRTVSDRKRIHEAAPSKECDDSSPGMIMFSRGIASSLLRSTSKAVSKMVTRRA